MTPAVFAIVAASPACTALLGTSPVRFYAFGEANQQTPKPYAVWQMPTSVPANYLGQLPDMDDARIQVDVYADTEASAEQTAMALRGAIQPHACELNASKRPRDPVTRSYGFTMDFEFFTPRDD
jgi:hypothetical protein